MKHRRLTNAGSVKQVETDGGEIANSCHPPTHALRLACTSHCRLPSSHSRETRQPWEHPLQDHPSTIPSPPLPPPAPSLPLSVMLGGGERGLLRSLYGAPRRGRADGTIVGFRESQQQCVAQVSLVMACHGLSRGNKQA